MVVRYQADLHIHTLLSPCAEVEMIPPLIVKQAIEVGLDMIAIADHNSAENVRAVIEAAEGSSLKVFPGMEVETAEGVHVLCIFDSAEQVESMQEKVYSALPDLPNQSEKLGNQMVVTAEAEFVRYNERLLLASTSLSIDEVILEVGARGGIAIPAHVDRRGYGLYGVLGLMPEEPRIPAVEISRRMSAEDARGNYKDLGCRAVIKSSDAHMLEDIGVCRTVFHIESRCVEEMKLAFAGSDGRSVECGN
jgi:3',5'-nucleoside bisphosphate phosphatase